MLPFPTREVITAIFEGIRIGIHWIHWITDERKLRFYYTLLTNFLDD